MTNTTATRSTEEVVASEKGEPLKLFERCFILPATMRPNGLPDSYRLVSYRYFALTTNLLRRIQKLPPRTSLIFKVSDDLY